MSPFTTASPHPSSTIAAQNVDALRSPLLVLPQLAQDFAAVYHDLAAASRDQFLPTPIRALPTGDETGSLLALDLGGSNLRVGRVELHGGNDFTIAPQRNWPIPEHLKSSAAELLFKWVAQRIAEVVRLCCEDEESVQMGVTFSFPMEQSSHTSAMLMPMGKGFTFSTTNDLSTLLSNAFTSLRKASVTPLPALKITAITNDSVATLLSAAYMHTTRGSRTAAGVIAGTGTNATCLIPRSKLRGSDETGTVLVNTEWSISGTLPAFAEHVTQWDAALDAANEKPGFQPFEEMVGGRYMGEVVRRVALDSLGLEKPPTLLKRPYGVCTKLCADVEGLSDPTALLAEYFKEDVENDEWTQEHVAIFKEICEAVSTRAAAMVAAATVGLLDVGDVLDGEESMVVGYTGTVLERNYGFLERTQEFLDMLAGEGRVRLVEAVDGGIVGAAVLAAMVKSGCT